MENQLAVINQVQVKQGLPLLKTFDEKFRSAVEESKIVTTSLEELKEVLRLAMLKLGIRGQNVPQNEEKIILLNHIVENYGNHTCAEISLAFDLALSGKLEVDAKPYENFSCLYFSLVMNAYRIWAKEPNYKIEQEKRRLELPYEQRGSLSDEEIKEWIEGWSEKLSDDKNIDYVPLMFYEWLYDNNSFKLTTEEKKEYLRKAIILKKQQFTERDIPTNHYMVRDYKEWERQLATNDFSVANHTVLQNLAKKMIVFDYLKGKINDTNV